MVRLFFPAALPLNRDDDRIRSYVAEAEDGNAVRQGFAFTGHHIDHDPARFVPFYQIVICGMQPDAEYNYRVYARNCLGRCVIEKSSVSSSAAYRPVLGLVRAS